MNFGLPALCIAVVGLSTPLAGTTTSFALLGDPGHNYTFARTDSPVGASVTEPVAPYPGWLGSNTPGNIYGFFCIDYLKGANWNTAYDGSVYNMLDTIPGKTTAQLVEAAYLSDRLYRAGGSAASTTLYQGPISFAIWQIMDPTPGHVPVDAAAQAFIAEAQWAYASHTVTLLSFPNTKIFVPNNTSIQDFMSLSLGVPEPGTLGTLAGGLALLAISALLRRLTKAGVL